MRLMNTTTYILEEFTGQEIPKYAILSHRWGNQEITFQDIQHFKNFRDYFKTRKSTKSEGWMKIRCSCERAVLDGLQWIWVDSCCIDKMSSAELSEAINSMFHWYRKAQVCYAYLSDVFIPWPDDGMNAASLASYQFRNSRWFRRGWTLQELLAPRKLIFFSRAWLSLGDRSELWTHVSEATGIKNEKGWEVASVAQKMSWASKRETTRNEDRAYSLMGLFGVNMPPLYGEGENAFIRLQLEILRTSDDESIFAWRDPENTSGGLLARSPDAFQHSGDIERFDSIHYEKPPYSMTNKGLSMEFSLVIASSQETSIFDADDTYLAPLQVREGNYYSMLGILLKCIRGNHYRRISSGEVISLPAWNHQMLSQMARRKVVQVKQEDDFQRSFFGVYQYKFFVASNVLSLKGFEVTARYASTSAWSNGGPKRLESGLIVWEDEDAAEKSILIGRVGVEGVTAALEFTRQIEEAPSRNPSIDTEPAAAEFEEVEAQITDAAQYADPERFIAIFNIYATRTRLGIIIPKKNDTIQALLDRLFQYHPGGDWMTAGQDLFPEPRLSSEARITAELVRDHTERGLTSYEAKISFEEARAELPNNEILPFELANNEISALPWRVLPGIPELENTLISNRKPHTLQNLMSANPLTNRHIASFLQHRDLEKQNNKYKDNELGNGDLVDQESDESGDNDDDNPEGYQDPKINETDEGSQPPSQATQLEIEELRRESVSPVLPDLHRMSGFGIDMFSLPLFSELEEPVPPIPAFHIPEFNLSLSKPTFSATRVDSPKPLSPTGSNVNANDEEEDNEWEDDDKAEEEEGLRNNGRGRLESIKKYATEKSGMDGDTYRGVSRMKERRRQRRRRTRK